MFTTSTGTFMFYYLLGMYSAAIHSMLESDDGTPANIAINAKMVIDHIIDRAREWPIVMVTVLEIRFAHLTFMLSLKDKG